MAPAAESGASSEGDGVEAGDAMGPAAEPLVGQPKLSCRWWAVEEVAEEGE